MFDNNIYGFGPSSDEDGIAIPVMTIGDDELKFDDQYAEIMPVIALKNTVLFPGVVFPITVGRNKSIKALNAADHKDKFIGVITQKDIESEDPSPDELYSVGTIAKILKVIKMPDGSTTAILQGRKRFMPVIYTGNEVMLEASIKVLEENIPFEDISFKALMQTIKEFAERIIELSPHIPSEANLMLQNIKNDGFLINFIASNINLPLGEKQILLQTEDYLDKANLIMIQMNKELAILNVKSEIESKVRGDLDKQQKEYFLNQQLKTIQEELGGNPHEQELNKLEERATKKKWSKEVKETFGKELLKARRVNPQIGEFSVILNYLELMLDLPWNELTKDNFDLKKVKDVLDKDHFGLKDVKERIIEHIAVLKLKKNMKAPIICLVGPPGVGKTSLGKSIATALGRQFIRMSLGGLHDESEIRGHRKTYIGAMPGRIIQSLKKAKSSNPVFILDEIDKLGKDFRGDPSSALLEVLDPEQNSTFHDNYLDIDYDLSKVLFIATANSLSTIQPALLDRMEIIELSGYSVEEKIEIAKDHLVPKQMTEHGLKKENVVISPPILQFIIEKYTRESGVRSLDRNIAGVFRSAAKMVAMDEPYDKQVDEAFVEKSLGPIRYDSEEYAKVDLPGVAVGLAWTRVGGDILFIEASTSKGKGKLVLTGNLGDVMKESATTALSYIRANSASFGLDPDVFDQTDLHIHVPEGAIPKDGPSAGVTMLTSILSAFKGKPVKSHLAMTGEITLRGKVLPVGGIKEKVLAAKRSGITEIMLCEENRRHVAQIPEEYLKDVTFTYVRTMDQVVENALGSLK